MDDDGIRGWTVHETLSESAFGTTCTAYDPAGRWAVLRLVRGDDGVISKVMHLVNRNAGLYDPALLPILDVLDPPQPGWATESLNGATAESYLAHGPLPWDAVTRLIVDVTHAIKYLAENAPMGQKLVHGGIYPGTLAWRHDGHGILIEPELAPMRQVLAKSRPFRDRPWLSPDLLRGRADLRTEIHNLGMSLVWLLTGKPPFEFRRTTDPEEWLSQRRAFDPQQVAAPLWDIHPTFYEVAVGCIAFEPFDRFSDTDEISDRLRPLLG